MERDEDKTAEHKRHRAAYVANETGVSEADVMTLIELIGMDTAALIREAQILKRSKYRKL